jgi:hypothetical protein
MQNMNRISHTPDAIEQEDDGETNEENYDTQDFNNDTTQAYRHGRCGLCDKPVTTVHLNPTETLTSITCKEMTEGTLNHSELFAYPEEQEHQQLMNYFLITTILQDMASLPPNQPVWRWENSTEAYCLITGLLPTHIQQISEFVAWYDKQIYVVYEIKQKRQRDYCLTHQHDQRDQHDHRDQDDWGSSSVDPITWLGARS